MKKIIVIISLFFIFIIGCTPDYKAKIESDTSWSGFFGNSTVSGSGNRTIDLPDEEIVCANCQKQTIYGYLKLTIVDEGSNFIFDFGGDINSATTNAEYGVVSVCNK